MIESIPNTLPSYSIKLESGVQNPVAILDLSEPTGSVNLNSFDQYSILSVQEPSRGMLAMIDDGFCYFNGREWKSVVMKTNALLSSGSSALVIDGITTGGGSKHLDSSLEINNSSKVLRVPVVVASDINDPLEGLLIFDTDHEELMIYDGSNWQIF